MSRALTAAAVLLGVPRLKIVPPALVLKFYREVLELESFAVPSVRRLEKPPLPIAHIGFILLGRFLDTFWVQSRYFLF
ncbi:MAG TPA: hypothetical protein VGH55_01125 [Chthoniobacterales bacterium]